MNLSDLYYIYDPERRMYWKMDKRGYTPNKVSALCLPLSDAKDICDQPLVKDFPVPVDSPWIFVSSHEEVPVGIWLCMVDTSRKGKSKRNVNPYQVIEVLKNVSLIGHHFAFDEGDVLAYRPLGELLDKDIEKVLMETQVEV